MKEVKEKLLKALFLIYCAALIYILFLHSRMRSGFYSFGIERFSREHFEMCNVVPFRTIGTYLKRLREDSINFNIVAVNIFGNLILFAPMGFFFCVLFGNRFRSVWKFLIAIIIMVIMAELIQFVTFMGAADVDDVILNVTGAAIGFYIGKSHF
jgi:glycopeptide antibiotics resistance protein